ncbi:MAG: hypothetical protein C4562_01055 [Actinobacteria bacterium]|nr:MAG: hypothetical protein C4562_01055 [Actinomycetota bacterium]
MFNIPVDNDKEASLKSPMSVAVYKGLVAVTDSDSGLVKFYRKDGSYLSQIKIAQGSYPISIAYSPDGTLFVADKISGVYVFPDTKTEKGRFKLPIQTSPLCLTTTETHVYIFDSSTGQILKIPYAELKKSNYKPKRFGSFDYINGLAYKNKLYMAESNTGFVSTTTDGSKIKKWQTKFSLPRGIAIDDQARVHIVDTFANTIKVFDLSEKYLFSYGSAGKEDGEVNFPNGIAIDDRNSHIYVTDKANSRVVVFGWR